MVRYALILALGSGSVGTGCSTSASLQLCTETLTSMGYKVDIISFHQHQHSDRNSPDVHELEARILKLELNKKLQVMVVALGGDGSGFPLSRHSEGQRLGFSSLISLLSEVLNPNAEVLLVAEGVSAGNSCLPFRYSEEDNSFRLTGKMAMVLQPLLLVSCDCYLELPYRTVTSSSSGDIGTDDETESPCPMIEAVFGQFSRSLFSEMGGPVSIGNLISNIRDQCSISVDVYSSYPLHPVLWSWIWNSNTEIYINQKISALVVLRNPK